MFVFFVPVQVLCTLQLKPSVCFVPVEVWYDSCYAIKTYYFAGYWNCLFKHDVVPLFLGGFLTQFFTANNTRYLYLIWEEI